MSYKAPLLDVLLCDEVRRRRSPCSSVLPLATAAVATTASRAGATAFPTVFAPLVLVPRRDAVSAPRAGDGEGSEAIPVREPADRGFRRGDEVPP